MESIVLPAVLDALTVEERRALRTDPAMASVQQVFAAVPDPRKRRGVRYDLPFLLICVVAALWCTCTTLAAVGQWCAEHRALLGRRSPHAHFLTPTGALYRWRLSVADVEWALAGCVRATHAVQEREALALDGKTMRGATVLQPDGTNAAPHLLSVSGHQRQATLIQVRVDGTTNDIPIAQALLPLLPPRGRIVTADARHTQTAFAQVVLDQGGDFLLCVNGTQPTLSDDSARAFADPATCCSPTVCTTDRRRGRIDVRSLRTTTDLNRSITSIPGVGQVAEVTCTVTRKGKVTVDVVFLVTSRTPARGSPAQLLAWIRGHWSIEARHHVRDGSFGEDHSRLRTGHAPQIMAALRNLCITLLYRTKHPEISAARRSFAYHPAQALALLLPKTRSA